MCAWPLIGQAWRGAVLVQAPGARTSVHLLSAITCTELRRRKARRCLG